MRRFYADTTHQKNLYVRYYSESGPDADVWTETEIFSSSQAKPGFAIERGTLTPGTDYHLEVSLDTDVNSRYTITIGFRTEGTPRVSSVRATDVTETSAKIHVGLADVKVIGLSETDLDNAVFWRYRVVGKEWQTKTPNYVLMDDNGGHFDLTGLTPDTTYEVEASLSSSFLPAKSARSKPFTTTAPGLGQLVVVEEQITATVSVPIKDPNGEYQTVHFRHCTLEVVGEAKQCDGAWPASTPISISTDPDSQEKTATWTVANLLVDTEYRVQASLQDTFPESEPGSSAVLTESEDFTTKRPRVTALGVTEAKQTTAKVTITIDHANGKKQTVNLRYRTYTLQNGAPVYDAWGDTVQANTFTTMTEKELERLKAGKKYQVEAWLDATRAETDRETATFGTAAPTVSGITVVAGSLTQTAVNLKVDIVPHGGSPQTVYLHYRAVGETVWQPENDPIARDTTADSETFALSNLTRVWRVVLCFAWSGGIRVEGVSTTFGVWRRWWG